MLKIRHLEEARVSHYSNINVLEVRVRNRLVIGEEGGNLSAEAVSVSNRSALGERAEPAEYAPDHSDALHFLSLLELGAEL